MSYQVVTHWMHNCRVLVCHASHVHEQLEVDAKDNNHHRRRPHKCGWASEHADWHESPHQRGLYESGLSMSLKRITHRKVRSVVDSRSQEIQFEECRRECRHSCSDLPVYARKYAQMEQNVSVSTLRRTTTWYNQAISCLPRNNYS